MAKLFLPKFFLTRYGSLIRSVISKRYAGDNHQCNVCEIKLDRFVRLNRGDLMCPKCGSLPRSRRLYKLLDEMVIDQKRSLHFSPPNCLKTKLSSRYEGYKSSDYKNEFEAELKLDITNVDLPDSCFDLIICYHVLEHIEDDRKAIKELYRILSLEGECIIQTPFKKGDIYEDDSIVSEEERLIHFDQKDHVRIYSANGLAQRLEHAGFQCKIMKFEEDKYYGMKGGETVIFAKKKNLL